LYNRPNSFAASPPPTIAEKKNAFHTRSDPDRPEKEMMSYAHKCRVLPFFLNRTKKQKKKNIFWVAPISFIIIINS
jgi:hypothetical protein